MYSDWVGSAIGGFLAVWLLVLTILVLRQKDFLKSLFPKSGERDIRKKFEEISEVVEKFKTILGKLEEKISGLEIDGIGHIQRVELLRFNPYEDTGGNISFTIAQLNKKGDGFVLTSLHARSGTRIFAKRVTAGKIDKGEFSKEEEEVIEKAMKQKIT